mgnify:CR=1 FL=1
MKLKKVKKFFKRKSESLNTTTKIFLALFFVTMLIVSSFLSIFGISSPILNLILSMVIVTYILTILPRFPFFETFFNKFEIKKQI